MSSSDGKDEDARADDSPLFIAMYWEDPFAFNPDRFIDTSDYRWNRDACESLNRVSCVRRSAQVLTRVARFAGQPFASGARACLGQRFALGASLSTLRRSPLRS